VAAGRPVTGVTVASTKIKANGVAERSGRQAQVCVRGVRGISRVAGRSGVMAGRLVCTGGR